MAKVLMIYGVNFIVIIAYISLFGIPETEPERRQFMDIVFLGWLTLVTFNLPIKEDSK